MKENFVGYRFWKLYLTITRFLMSFRQRNTYHIGTMVYHIPTGRVMYVSQGFMYYDYKTGIKSCKLRSPKDGKIFNYVTKDDIQLMPGFKNWWYNATAWWGWYKQNWLEMDARAKADGQQLRSVYILGKDVATAKR